MQHLIREAAGVVAEWVLDKEATVVVCGSAQKMPGDVQKAFQDVLVAARGLSEAEAGSFIRGMELRRKYLVEVWS